MNQITLLEFCQVPENRIKLMEHLIQELPKVTGWDYYICNIINSNEFYTNFRKPNNIDGLMQCSGKSKENVYGVNHNQVRLDQLLPELEKYKHYKDAQQEVWFYPTLGENDEVDLRIAALKNAITDIKNNLA